MISFDHPLFLLFLPLLPAAAAFSLVRFARITGKSGFLRANDRNVQNRCRSLKRRFMARSVLWTAAFACLIVAWAGPYWGTKPGMVQTSGNAVSFVFDISYSMTAPDMPLLKPGAPKTTRLAYMGEYAAQLLRRLNGIPVSAVLAKGGGVIAVPATEDHTAVASLIASLSPRLLSAPGSDLGDGVLKAIRSFPPQSAAAASIIVFTDGDETSSTLESAVREALKYGITPVLVGIGSKTETEITAGDGTTQVKTALRETHLQKIIADLPKKNARALYVNAADTGSALAVLSAIQPSKNTREAENAAYGREDVPRFMIFLTAAFIFFAAGFIAGELRTGKKPKNMAVMLLLAVFACTSCSVSLETPAQMLSGVLAWHRQNYEGAVTSFLRAKESAAADADKTAGYYAQFALAAAYLMQNETEAASERLAAIPEDAPSAVSFGVWYNSGLIAHREGNYALAADCFKQALRIDPANTDAKINLELSMRQESVLPRQGKQEMIPVNEPQENNAVRDSVFSIIREKEQNQWKSQPNQNTSKNVIDY